MNIKKILSIAIIFVISISFASCGNTDQKVENELVIGTTMAIENPRVGEYNFDMLCSGFARPAVCMQNEDGEYESEFFTWTADENVWTFKVKDDLNYYWSNGDDITAENLSLAMQSEEIYANLVEAYELSMDEMTLKLTLKQVNARFISNLTSLRLVFDNSLDQDLYYGPYVFSDYDVRSGKLTFTKNEYYRGDVSFSKITVILFNSDETMYAALNAGDIDTVWNYGTGVPSNYQDILNTDNLNIVSVVASNRPAVLAFNTSSAEFSDLNIRKAVLYSLDYADIAVYLGGSMASGGMNVERDIEAAGAYLEGEDLPYEFTLSVNSSKTANVSAAEIVKRQLEDTGLFKVDIEVLDSTAFNAKTSNKFSEKNITFEAAVMTFTANGMAMGAGMGTIYVDKNHAVQGACQVDSSEFYLIESEMSNAVNMEEYQDACQMMQEYYDEYIPFIPLYLDNLVYACSKDVNMNNIDLIFGLNNLRNYIR